MKRPSTTLRHQSNCSTDNVTATLINAGFLGQSHFLWVFHNKSLLKPLHFTVWGFLLVWKWEPWMIIRKTKRTTETMSRDVDDLSNFGSCRAIFMGKKNKNKKHSCTEPRCHEAVFRQYQMVQATVLNHKKASSSSWNGVLTPRCVSHRGAC